MNKQIKAIATLAKKAPKETLRVVKFGKNKAVATDSFSLIELNGVKGEGVFLAKPLSAIGMKDELEMGKEEITINREDGSSSKLTAGAPIFPEYEQLFPKTFIKEIRVNAMYLAAVLEAMEGLDPHNGVVIKIAEKDYAPITVEVEGKARALVMPMIK